MQEGAIECNGWVANSEERQGKGGEGKKEEVFDPVVSYFF